MSKLFNAGKAWTSEELDRVATLYNEGKSLKEICLSIGRSPSGTLSKMSQCRMIWADGSGNYYPYPEVPFAMWQEVKELNEFMKRDDDD